MTQSLYCNDSLTLIPMSDQSCLFCGIVSGEIPTEFIHKDDEVAVFRDLHPKAPFHVLVIPVRHIESFDALTYEDSQLLIKMVTVIQDITKAPGLDGYKVLTNAGAGAGQVIPHLHFHILSGTKTANGI